MTPDTYTNQETYLRVSEDHTLYVHDWGNKSASTTYIYLHGGPGSGCRDGYKALFNPESMRVIFFDQRGCGKSTPYGSLRNNTTADLVHDISAIADHLDIHKFVLVGRSWGSCLALAYSIANPKRVTAIVTGGIYTGNTADTDFLLKGGFRSFFPDAWEAYLARTPKKHHADPSAYHTRRILGDNVRQARTSAYARAELEHSLVYLDDRHTPCDIHTFDPVNVTIETHYTANGCFMPENFILNNAHKLTMPIWIVQGRYDAVCHPESAYTLHKKLPNSALQWTIAGHSNSDRANVDATKVIIESLAQ